MRRIFLLFLAVSWSLHSIAQLKIQDSISLAPIAGANVYSDSGTLLGMSDVEGIIQLDSLKAIPSKDVLINHIAYKNIELSFADFNKAKVILLAPRQIPIEEIGIVDRSKFDYVVLKGYFRNYETYNNRSRYLYDGIVSHYIPINKTKGKTRTQIHQYRIYANDVANEELKDTQGELFYFKPMLSPMQKKSIVARVAEEGKLIKSGDRLILEREGRQAGYAQLGSDGNMQVFYNLVSPGTVRSISFFRLKAELYKSIILHTYRGKNLSDPDIADLNSAVVTVSAAFKRQKKYGLVPRDYSHEFYVMERSFITNEEFKALKPELNRSSFLEEKSDYNTPFWEDLDRFGIPPLIRSISSKIGQELKLK